MATQATLRFLGRNEGSPGAHLYGMKRQLAKERPLPMHAPGICFLVSFLPPFQFHPSVLPFFLLFVQSLLRSMFRSFVRMRSLDHSSVGSFNRSFVVRSLFNRSFARSIVRSIVSSIIVKCSLPVIFKHNNICKYFSVQPCVGHRAVLLCPFEHSLISNVRRADPKLREADYATNLSDSAGHPSALFQSSDTKQMSSFHFFTVSLGLSPA